MLLALLLAATPVTGKTLKARTESGHIASEFRRGLAIVRKGALEKAWWAAGQGWYTTYYCMPRPYADYPEIKPTIKKNLEEIGIDVTYTDYNECLGMGWFKP